MDEPVYTPAGFFMVRTPVLPATTLWSNVDTSRPRDRLRSEGRRALRELATDTRVKQALHAASPGLTAGLARPPGGKRGARVEATLLRYLTRMSNRPTPHGLFAGVGLGHFGDTTDMGLATDPVRLTRTRADAGWLLTVIARLEADTEIRDLLPLRRNDLLQRVAGRAVLPRTRSDHTEHDRRVDIRLTGPAEDAIGLASTETAYCELVAALMERYPRASEARVRDLLAKLWELDLIGSDLRPPMTAVFPERHLAARLDGVSAATAEGLRDMRALADEADEAVGRADPSVLEKLTDAQRQLTPGFNGPTYQLDTALALTGTGLAEPIGLAAAEAGELLMRLGCVQPRLEHVISYHHVFLETYGAGSEVPLLEALSPELGIDAPNTFVSPVRSAPLPTFAGPTPDRRDRALVRVAAEAIRRGERAVELTGGLLEELTVWRPDDPRSRPRPSLDVYFQLAAASRRAVDAGDWTMVLSPAGMFKGLQTFGRFLDLFDEGALAEVRAFARAEEAAIPEVIVAELNSEAPHARGGNLVIRPQVREYEISVNAAPTLPPERQIRLDEVLLGATGDRFYLWSARHGRELMVVQSHAYTQFMAPNVCRALLEFSADGFAPPSRFDWGSAKESPFLPRLTRGRIVIAPAQWNLTATILDGLPEDPDACFEAVQRWRGEWRVPRRVYLTTSDHRLLLDLEHPLCTDELFRELSRRARKGDTSALRLHEVLPDEPDLWVRDARGQAYHSEFVVPTRARGRIEARPATGAATPAANGTPGRRLLPGSEWTHLKLYSSTEQHPEILTGPLQPFLEALHADGLVDRWFYIRYFDPLPHLRLRFHTLDPRSADTVVARCAAWARRMVEAEAAVDFSLARYDREMERYGGPEAITALEDVFCANSVACTELLALLREHDDLEPELVAAVALHRLYEAWSFDAAETRAIRLGHGVSEQSHVRFRKSRPLLCELMAPGGPRPDPRAGRYAGRLDAVFSRQEATIAAAAGRVRALAGKGLLLRSEAAIMDSLTHMQANRLLGADRPREELCYDLWALADRAVEFRPTEKGRP